jgi:short-subunit dehydrogenase
VVTGASSRIGREIALRLAASGRNLILVRRQGLLEELASDLIGRRGIETRVIAADFATKAGIEAVAAGSGDLDVGLLVAAAGFGTSGPFLDSDLTQELEMLDVNRRALLSQACILDAASPNAAGAACRTKAARSSGAASVPLH